MKEILLFLLKGTRTSYFTVKSNVGMTMVLIMAVSAMDTNLKSDTINKIKFVNCGDYVFFPIR